MKQLALIVTGLVISLTTFAQGKYGATPQDSVKCIECLIYKDYMKSQNPEDKKLALELWRCAYKTCPQSQKTLYINGVKLYKNLAKEAGKAKDAASQKAYLDTMFSIYDQRIEMFGQKGMVLGMKGQSMLSTKQPKEATFAVLNEAVELTGDKTQSGTLVATMFAIINLEKAGKKTKEEVVEMFGKISAILDVNISKYTAKEEANAKLVETANSTDKDGNNIEHKTYTIGDGTKTIIKVYVNGKFDKRLDINKKPLKSKLDQYVKAQQKILNVTSPYLSCEVLVPLAEKNFEANKENVDWLRRTVKLLKAKKCYEAEIFSKIAEAYFALEPSAEGAEGMGKLFLGKKDYAKAVDFFKKALEMAEADEEKAQYSLSVAEAYLYAKNYSSAKSFAQKALGLKSGWGEPYLVIGDAYMYSAKSCDDGKLGKYGAYWAAVDKYSKAKAVDASVASDASKKIARASANYPLTKDAFFHSVKNGDSYTCGCWIGETTTVRTK